MVWRVEWKRPNRKPPVRRQESTRAAPGRLPGGSRVYAVGDVHGCAAQLRAMHEAIAAHLAANPVATATLVHLGDYVDRGPDSAGVVAMLRKGSPIAGASSVCLMGNHERTMLDALDGDRAAATDWLFNGGGAALESWGIDPGSPRDAWRDAMPSDDVDWLRGRALSFHAGDYMFVHAGVRPGVALGAQTPDDLIRIRQVFLSSDADFGAIVVHGHTVKWEPVIRPNRIGIDTGAVFGGALTCAVLEGDTMAFLRIGGPR